MRWGGRNEMMREGEGEEKKKRKQGGEGREGRKERKKKGRKERMCDGRTNNKHT
jgi:hypothetical protein